MGFLINMFFKLSTVRNKQILVGIYVFLLSFVKCDKFVRLKVIFFVPFSTSDSNKTARTLVNFSCKSQDPSFPHHPTNKIDYLSKFALPNWFTLMTYHFFAIPYRTILGFSFRKTCKNEMVTLYSDLCTYARGMNLIIQKLILNSHNKPL